MTFIWPWMLVALFLAPLFAVVYIRLLAKRQQAAANLGPLGIARDSSGRSPGWRRHIPAVLVLCGLALLFFSLSRPELMVNLPRVEGTVILAFDVSNSMAADDMEPTRMEAAKAAARTFVEHQPSTVQVGIVAFSNGGFVIQPPTDDQDLLLSAIDRLEPQGATSLAQGIFNALNAIAGEPIAIDPEALEEGVPVEIGSYPSAVVLLLTDGENTTAPEPLDSAQLAAQAGVRVYTVGIGSLEGAVLDIEGYSILSQLNETALQEIANLTNGAYYRADDADALQDIYKHIDLQLAVSGQKMEITALLAGSSLLFFVASGVLSLFWFGRVPL
jgi:Ca-activated chloride channel family protein